jgi:hypothetical protein
VAGLPAYNGPRRSGTRKFGIEIFPPTCDAPHLVGRGSATRCDHFWAHRLMSFPLEIAAGDFAFAARHRRIVISFVADNFYRERHHQGRNLKLDCTHPAKESAACLAILQPCWTFVTGDRLSYHNARPAKARSGCQRPVGKCRHEVLEKKRLLRAHIGDSAQCRRFTSNGQHAANSDASLKVRVRAVRPRDLARTKSPTDPCLE